MNADMTIERGWTKDDFIKNLITLRLDDPDKQLRIVFKGELHKPNMTDSIAQMLIVYKAVKRFKAQAKAGVTGAFTWPEIL